MFGSFLTKEKIFVKKIFSKNFEKLVKLPLNFLQFQSGVKSISTQILDFVIISHYYEP